MISINVSELIWTVINFFLLLFLLKHFLYTPIIRFMEQRQARIDAGLEAESQARKSLNENARDMAEQKAKIRGAAAELLNAAEAEDARRAADSYVQARKKADAVQESGEADLRKRHAQEAEELAAREPELAALLAAHLLGEEE